MKTFSSDVKSLSLFSVQPGHKVLCFCALFSPTVSRSVIVSCHNVRLKLMFCGFGSVMTSKACLLLFSYEILAPRSRDV